MKREHNEGLNASPRTTTEWRNETTTDGNVNGTRKKEHITIKKGKWICLLLTSMMACLRCSLSLQDIIFVTILKNSCKNKTTYRFSRNCGSNKFASIAAYCYRRWIGYPSHTPLTTIRARTKPLITVAFPEIAAAASLKNSKKKKKMLMIQSTKVY